MSQFQGNLGWIAIGNEAAAYGTAAITDDMVYQHAIRSSMKPQETRIKSPALGSNSATTGLRILSWSSGQVTIGHSDEGDEVGVIYSHFGSLATATYTFGGTPTVTSHTVFVDYNGVEYDFVGCCANSISWNLINNGVSTITLDYIGRYPSKYGGAARSPSLPPEAEIVVPGDLATFTIGGTAIGSCTLSTITFSHPFTGMERTPLGSAVLRQPIRSDRPTITATFNVELDSADGNNTVAELDDLIGDGAPGAIVLDNFTLGGCKFVGEIPDLQAGLVGVTLSVEAESLTVVTT